MKFLRKLIIDTDTGSDDAVALMMAALSPEIELLGVTTVCGNVPLELGTRNALMTLQVCGRSDVAVYPGAQRPLFRELVTAVNVHGQDGMGDRGLIHPARQPSDIHAVDFILDSVKKTDDVELVMLGPATNIALALLRDRRTMQRVRRIYTMGTAGFGPGNTTPVAEFNVYADAESYKILLQSGIPITIIGYDMCVAEAAWTRADIEAIRQPGTVGEFAVDCNSALLAYNLNRANDYSIDLPDAVAMSVALWNDTALRVIPAYCFCCTVEEPSYGQVIINDPAHTLAIPKHLPPCNADIVAAFDGAAYKRRLAGLLKARSHS